MMKKIAAISSIFLALCLYTSQAFAVCPLCTIIVGAGLGLDRYFGVDDTISGVWIGGLLVSLIIWTIDWMNQKNYRFYGRKILITLLYFGFVFIPLYLQGIIGSPLNKLWGMDKLIVGTILGSIFFLVGAILYEFIKKKNKGHAQFPFQKILMPIAPLILLTIIFFFMFHR
jgi:hypothetical protein